jgi:hypothetical protein
MQDSGGSETASHDVTAQFCFLLLQLVQALCIPSEHPCVGYFFGMSFATFSKRSLNNKE